MCCEKCQDKETSSTPHITFNISGNQTIHQILPNSPHSFSTHTKDKLHTRRVLVCD